MGARRCGPHAGCSLTMSECCVYMQWLLAPCHPEGRKFPPSGTEIARVPEPAGVLTHTIVDTVRFVFVLAGSQQELISERPMQSSKQLGSDVELRPSNYVGFYAQSAGW